VRPVGSAALGSRQVSGILTNLGPPKQQSHSARKYITVAEYFPLGAFGRGKVGDGDESDVSSIQRFLASTLSCFRNSTLPRFCIPCFRASTFPCYSTTLSRFRTSTLSRFRIPCFRASTFPCFHAFALPHFHAFTFPHPCFHASAFPCFHAFALPHFHAFALRHSPASMLPRFRAETFWSFALPRLHISAFTSTLTHFGICIY
jgi:hypothetical protein